MALRGQVGMAVQAGADGGAAEGQFLDGLDAPCGRGRRRARPAGVAVELLAEPDGRGVHEVGAADLEHVPEFRAPSFRAQRAGLPARAGAFAVQLLRDGDVHGGGEDVVGRLPHVHVVVRMDGVLGADGLAGDLADAVRDDLVGVHVRAGAGAGLVDVEREMGVELALGDFERGLLDERRPCPSGGCRVRRCDFGGGPFDEAVGVDDRGRGRAGR